MKSNRALLVAALSAVLLVMGCTDTSPKPVRTPGKEAEAPAPNESGEDTNKPPLPEGKVEVQEYARLGELVGFEGPIEEAVRWTDQSGEYIVITSEKNKYWTGSADEEGILQNAEVSCFCYRKGPGEETYERSWKIHDFAKDCPVDAIARFVKNVLQHTDLDSDGIPEVWVMYYVACKGDVSPSVLKLIMYEGSDKYKITGETKVNVGNETYVGGKIGSEGRFKGQKQFLAFGRALWERHCTETFAD